MRALTIGLFLSLVCSVAFASDWQQTLNTVAGAYSVLQGARSADPGRPAPAYTPPPVRRTGQGQFPLEWKREDTPGGPAIVDASGRCGYFSPWAHSLVPNETVKSCVETVGCQYGLPFSPDDKQTQATQNRSSKPGYDPDTAPAQGLQVAPAGYIQVTVTYAGYAKSLLVEGSGWSKGVKYFQETYKVSLQATVTSTKSGLQVATASAEGQSTAKFREGQVASGGYSVNVEESIRARPDQACQQATSALMGQLTSQLMRSSANAGSSQSNIVVAGISGLTLYLATADDSRIRDAGVVESFRYSVRGGVMRNPVTGQAIGGQPVVCIVEIVDIDGAMATGRVQVETPDQAARISSLVKVGDRVTLVPYQSLHTEVK